MAANKRTAFVKAYNQLTSYKSFLYSFFTTTSQDIHNAEAIAIEVKRGTRKIAPVISEQVQRGGEIKSSLYTQKEFIPPIVAVSSSFSPGDLTKKQFGKTEYQSAEESYSAQLQVLFGERLMEMEDQVHRNPEFQAAQVFQTGKLELRDAKGNIGYTLDFKAKASHFPTVGTNWSDPASDPDADITALRRTIKKDAGVSIKHIIFGKTALENYLKNPNVKEKFDLRRIESGVFDPDEISTDADFLGDILIGTKKLAAWIYEGEYENPSNPGEILPFVEDDKVILLPDPTGTNVDFRGSWCKVPTFGDIDEKYRDLIPTNFMLDDRQFTHRLWNDKDLDLLKTEIKARPLCIPVSIDAFGCLDTAI